MDGVINQLSEAIGALRAETKAAKEARDRLEEKIDRIATALSTMRGDVDGMKNRGIGMLIGISLASSVVGAKLSSAFQKLFP